jgi:hypothetical protein
VDTLALSRPPFDSFVCPLQQGCMLLAEPSYLLYLTLIKAMFAHGPLRVQTPLSKALPMVVQPQLTPDQLVL